MEEDTRFVPHNVVAPTSVPRIGIRAVLLGAGNESVAEGPPEVTTLARPTVIATPAIGIYVRRDETSDPKIKARVVSLRPIPDKASMDELLAIGFGYDGDTVTAGVTAATCVVWRELPPDTSTRGALSDSPEALPCIEPLEDSDPPRTLSQALNEVQSCLVQWLRRLGYEVKIA